MTERGYLGEVLEELRLERGLSLRDLAAQAGLTAGYLSQLESGKQKNPSLEKLRGLAAALGVSITVVRDEPGFIRVWKDSPSCVSFVSVGSTPRRDAPSIAIIHESEAPGIWDEQKTHFKPDWTSSPGDTIADILEERGLTPEDLAGRADLSLGYVNELLKGRAVITSEVAAGLQRALGSTVKFWLEREANYRKALAGKVAIGVDPGAGPDQQAVTFWKVKDRQWTELDSDLAKEAELWGIGPGYVPCLSKFRLARAFEDSTLTVWLRSMTQTEKALAAERLLAHLQATAPLFKTVPPPPPELLAELEAYKPLPHTDAPQPDSDDPAPLGEE